MLYDTVLFSLPAQDVDPDQPWIFWPEPPGPRLLESLATLGQTAPVLVEPAPEGGFRLVAGRKRLLALRELGRAVRCVRVQADAVGKGLLYLADNASREATPAMLVRAARYFLPLLPRDELAARLCPALGLEPRSRLWRRVEAWLDLPAGEGGFAPLLDDGRIPLDCVDTLALLGPDELAALRPYLAAARWSRSAATHFCALLFEASRARRETVAQVAARAGLADILARELSPRDRIEALLDAARRARFPELWRLRDESDRLLAELAAGSSWRLERPDDFETDVVVATARIVRGADLALLAAQLGRVAESGLWDRLWRLAEPDAGGAES